MLWRLLRKNISAAQIAAYALAAFVGLTIVITAVSFHSAASAVIGSTSDPSSADYMVLSRRVSLVNTIGGSKAITPDDIADIEAQPWASRVGVFGTADFNVAAYIELYGRHISTYLFLESVPDAFIDQIPYGWTFSPDDVRPGEPLPDIPIIISKDYLALYNFGFAASRGLPQLTEGLISQVPITLVIQGNQQFARFPAHIAGFSSRLNTIAVPEQFLEWANSVFSDPDEIGSKSGDGPSRLIVQLAKPGDPAIDTYLDHHGYEMAGEKTGSSRAAWYLTLATAVVVGIGAVISILALAILLLSIRLLMQKNAQKIRDLLLLGYSPRQISNCYFILIGVVNTIILLAAVTVMLILSHTWSQLLDSAELPSASPAAAIIWGIVVMAIVTAINFLAIARSIRARFHSAPAA